MRGELWRVTKHLMWVSAYSRLPGGSRAVNPNDVEASAYLLIVKPDLRLPEIQSAVHTFLRTNLTHEKLPQCMLSSCRDEAVFQPLKHLPNAWLTIVLAVPYTVWVAFGLQLKRLLQCAVEDVAELLADSGKRGNLWMQSTVQALHTHDQAGMKLVFCPWDT